MEERSLSCMGPHMPQHFRCFIFPCQQYTGWVSLAAEHSKNAKHADIIAGVDFVPFVIEMSGVCGEQALVLVTEVGRRMAEVSKEPRSTTFLRQRLSVAVERGNVACILGTLRGSVSSKQRWTTTLIY